MFSKEDEQEGVMADAKEEVKAKGHEDLEAEVARAKARMERSGPPSERSTRMWADRAPSHKNE